MTYIDILTSMVADPRLLAGSKAPEVCRYAAKLQRNAAI